MPTSPWDETRRRWRGRLLNIPAARVGLTRGRWHNAQRLLQAVLWFDQKGQGCWAGSAALAEEADLSRTTLGRAKRDALELGLLTLERRSNPGPYGGRLPDRLRVEIDVLAELLEEQGDEAGSLSVFPTPHGEDQGGGAPTPDLPHGGGSHELPLSAQADDATPQVADPSAQRDAYIEEQTQQQPHNKQPPPPRGSDGRASPAEAAWRVVEGELFQLGLNQASAAVRDARTAGLSPAEVHAIADHWRPRREAWGAHTHAVLRRRLQRAAPGESADSGWPPYDAHSPTAAAERVDRQSAEARRQRERKRRERGDALVARLTPEERRRLGSEARRRTPALARPGVSGARVFEEGVLPLLEELGDEAAVRALLRAA